LQAADRVAPSDGLEWRAVSLGALKVTVLHGQQEQAADGRLVSDLLAECVAAHELPVVAVLRGDLGFGASRRLHRSRPLMPSRHLPMVATAIGQLDRVRAMLADLDAAARPTLVTVEAARLLDGDLDTGPLARDPEREATRLTVYVGGGEEVEGRPAHQLVVEALLRHGVDGATVLPGVDGNLYGRRPPGANGAGREVPTMVVAVGAAEPVAEGLAEVRRALDRPVATLERVHVWRRSGTEVAAPAPAPPGRTWQRLTVYSNEGARHGGRPLHVELARRLLRAGAPGATAVRGIGGYGGGGVVLTEVVDQATTMPRWQAVAAEVTDQAGLVTVEHVPECRPAHSPARA
jgi:PII-like signaling protein